MKHNNKFAIVLFGAPGSGKTTIGDKLSEEIDNSIFISVGSVMREELKMTPPYLNSDRNKVMEHIYNKYTGSNAKLLIIDCNPFPQEMWQAFIKTTLSFKKIYLCIKAPDNVLIERMHSRGRIDNKNFTYEQRLSYFNKNVDPEIRKIMQKEDVIMFQNLHKDDISKIVDEIKTIYSKLTNIKY